MVNFSVQDIDADEFLSGNYVDNILEAENAEKGYGKRKRSNASPEGQVNTNEKEGKVLNDGGGGASNGCVVGGDLEGKASGEYESRSSPSEEEDDEDEIASHGRELRELSSIDPEFHRFIQSEEPELLRIEDRELETNEDILTEEEGLAGNKKTEEEHEHSTQQKVLSWKLLRDYKKAAFVKKSIKGLKQLLAAFHSICAEGDNNDENKGGGKRQGRQAKFWVPDPDIRDALMQCCVSQSYKAFLWHLFPEEVKNAVSSVDCISDGEGSKLSLQARKDAAVASLTLDKSITTKVSTLPQYKALKPMIYGFLRALLRLVGNTVDRKLLRFIFEILEHYVLFFALFPGVAKAWLKFLLKSWSDPRNTGDTDGAVLQVLSFFRIRSMALRLPPPFLEECLRGTYLEYARVAKFMNEQTRLSLTFMGNGIVELYSIDVTVAYQNAFTYVRQLALVLRQALIKRDAGSMAELFQWQYIQCLRIWVAVVVGMPAQDELGMILYSLAQVISGVATMANSLFLAPTRFHCISMLHELAAAGNVYIPTWSLLLDIIDSPKLKKKAAPSTSPLPQLQNIVKLGDDVLKSETVQTAVVSRAFDLLDEAVYVYSHAAALPEVSYILLPRLRKYVKHIQRPRWRKLASDVINKLESASLRVIQNRNEEFGAPSEFVCLVNSLPPQRKRQHSVMIEKQQHVVKPSSSSSPTKEIAETIINCNIEGENDLSHLPNGRKVNRQLEKTSAAAPTLKKSEPLDNEDDADIVQDLKGVWSDDE